MENVIVVTHNCSKEVFFYKTFAHFLFKLVQTSKPRKPEVALQFSVDLYRELAEPRGRRFMVNRAAACKTIAHFLFKLVQTSRPRKLEVALQFSVDRYRELAGPHGRRFMVNRVAACNAMYF